MVKGIWFILIVGAAALFMATQIDSIRNLASKDDGAIPALNEALTGLRAPQKQVVNPAEVTSEEAALTPKNPSSEQAELVDTKTLSLECTDGDLLSCNTLASFYLKRMATPEDLQSAKTFAIKSCTEEDWDGCAILTQLGMLYKDGRAGQADEIEARSLFEGACDAGFARGCLSLFRSHRREYKEGLQIDQNVEAAGQAVQKTCHSKYQAADQSECRLAHEQLTDDLARPRGGLSAKVRKRVLKFIESLDLGQELN